jgi:NADPH:quinone reductase
MYTAIECPTFGPIDGLRLIERESPELRPSTIRIAVSACGVNFVDSLLVEGRYQIKPPVPFVPGMEVVGRVSELASDVSSLDGAPLQVGDRVFANVGFGGYASEAVAPLSQVSRVAPSLSDGQAATFMQSYMTGWYALCVRAQVQAGQTILVLGAGSGVGLAAVDLASALGLHVIAAASTADKRALATSLGAEATIDTAALDAAAVKDAAKEFAASFADASVAGGGGGGGVDHLYDPVGGDLGATCLRALGDDGQYLVIGFVAGIPSLPANQVLLRNRRVIGVDWGAWASRHPEGNQAMLASILELIERGDLAPVEPTIYALADAPRALADLAGRKVAGKVALVP